MSKALKNKTKLNDIVSVVDFGADNTGATGASTAIQAAINSGSKEVIIPPGTYLINADLTVPSNVHIKFLKGAIFKASANNRVFFKSANLTQTWFVQIWNAYLDVDGKTGCVGMDFSGLRHAAGIFFPIFVGAFDHCIKLTELCWDCIIEEPFAQGCVNGILVAHGSNAVQIRKPGFDGLGSAGYGVKIIGGATYPTTSVAVLGGYIQGFSGAGGVGVWDAGSGTTNGTYGTVIRDTYFELNSFSDIYWDRSYYATASGCQHYVTFGSNANFGRNCEGVRIYSPLMTSGSRTVGLYNFDTSNIACFGDRVNGGATGINTPVGTVTGIGSLPSEEWGDFPSPGVVVASTGGATTTINYTTRLAKWHRIGQRVNIKAQVKWDTWTGAAGNIVIQGVPAFLEPTSYSPASIGNVLGLMPWTGANLYCYLNGTGRDIIVTQNTVGGANTPLAMTALGELSLDLTYTL